MPMVMPLPNEDYEKDTKSVVVKYKFEPQEIYVHYYMSSALAPHKFLCKSKS